jgi:hypothetical protein
MIIRVRIQRLTLDRQYEPSVSTITGAIANELQGLSGDPARWSSRIVKDRLGTAISRRTISRPPDA